MILWACTGCGFRITGPSERELKRRKRAGLARTRWMMGDALREPDDDDDRETAGANPPAT